MSNNFQESYQKRRLLTGYISVVLSITFVLFLVGIFGLLLLNTKRVADHFKEQIVMTVYFNDAAKDIEITQLQKKIQLNPATKTVLYVSKETAAAKYAQDIGEDFVEFLGFNPLLNSLDVTFNAVFVNASTLTQLQEELEANGFVSEVVYDQPLVSLLDENIKKISWVLLVIAVLFVVIALLLINSSIRLSIFSKRFIIKTMQLVGANKAFIRRPFIWTHLKLGLLSALFATLLLAGLFYELNRRYPELEMLNDPLSIGIILAGIFVLGLGITGLSTFFATQRYLNLKTEAVY